MTTFTRTKIAEMLRIVERMRRDPTADNCRQGCKEIRFLLIVIEGEASSEIAREAMGRAS